MSGTRAKVLLLFSFRFEGAASPLDAVVYTVSLLSNLQLGQVLELWNRGPLGSGLRGLLNFAALGVWLGIETS